MSMIDFTPNKRTAEWLLGMLAVGASLIALISPLKVGAVFVVVASLALAYMRPRFMIVCLAVLVAFEPFALKWVPEDLYVPARYFSEVMVYVLFAFACIHMLVGKIRFRLSPLFLLAASIAVIGIASALVNETPAQVAVLGIRQIIRFFILGYVAFLYDEHVSLSTSAKLAFSSGSFLKKIVTVILALVAFESIVGIAQSIGGKPFDQFLIPAAQKFAGDIQLTAGTIQFWEYGQRVFATMGRYDQLGTFLVFGLLLAVGLLYEFRTKKHTKLLMGIVALGVIALILTYSRASWFGFLLGVFCIGAFVKKDRRVLSTYALSAALVIGYLTYSWAAVSHLTDVPSQTVLERFTEAFSYERWRGEYMGLGRLYYIVHTPTNVISAAPVFGVGPGSYGGGAVAALGYKGAYEQTDMPFGIYGTSGYIDNNWFSLWGELGTVGLLVYASLFILLVRYALFLYRVHPDPFVRGVALGFVGCVSAVTFQAFLGTYLEVRTLAFYFWLIAGLLAAQHARLVVHLDKRMEEKQSRGLEVGHPHAGDSIVLMTNKFQMTSTK